MSCLRRPGSCVATDVAVKSAVPWRVTASCTMFRGVRCDPLPPSICGRVSLRLRLIGPVAIERCPQGIPVDTVELRYDAADHEERPSARGKLRRLEQRHDVREPGGAECGEESRRRRIGLTQQ